MNKKATSPLIVSVVLVGFAMILAVSVFSYTTFENLRIQNNIEKVVSSPLIVKYDVNFHSGNCDVKGYQCGVNEEGMSCYSLLIQNWEDEDIAYYIWTEGNKGVSICGPHELEPYQSEIFNVYFNEVKVGSPPEIDAKIIPAIIT